MQKHTGTLDVTLPSDREVAMTRVFDAPRALVFEAWTTPELLRRWLGVFAGHTMTVCNVDLKVGGSYRYEWRLRNGSKLGISGVYREIVPNERLVNTEVFDAPYDQGEAIATTTFVERDGQTTVTTTVISPSREVRDAVLATGMTRGVIASYDNLDEVLESLARKESK
jgi:uncharacterized protein YndB with AHSA1/START domain